MATVDFGEWRIQSDKHCWWLGKPMEVNSARDGVIVQWKDLTYHATLSQALQALVEHDIRDSDLVGVEAIQSKLRELKTGLGGLGV